MRTKWIEKPILLALTAILLLGMTACAGKAGFCASDPGGLSPAHRRHAGFRPLSLNANLSDFNGCARFRNDDCFTYDNDNNPGGCGRGGFTGRAFD